MAGTKRWLNVVLVVGVLALGVSILPGAEPAEATVRVPVAYAPMPEGASSFGAVADGGWLYVYGGHLGKTHVYSATGVSGKFNRLNLMDGKTWEDLPSGPMLQGMNLVSGWGPQWVCALGMHDGRRVVHELRGWVDAAVKRQG